MMMRIQQIIFESGYAGLLKRVALRLERECNELLFFVKSTWKGSYQKHNQQNLQACLLDPINLDLLKKSIQIPLEVISHYLEHRFDLLGSGWTQVFYGMNCRGLENHRFEMGESVQIDQKGYWLKDRINSSNLQKAQQIWQAISADYKPIDWQLDFKSGYRWSERICSKKINFGHKLGADIKVPWELARMQHLPQLALAYLCPTTSDHLKHRIQSEYQNQILDFMATNPPGFGVNWYCPMDIAIRAVNWLLARDLFLSSGIKFSAQFEMLLARSIYEHGRYIVANLEWNIHRSNHYLADIAGLAFIASYLPSTTEIDTWLAFAVQELNVEVPRQFYKDGGNFEGSTAYHRLSAEMVYYASSLIIGLPKEKLEKLKSYDHKLFKNRWGKPHLKPAPQIFYPILNQNLLSPFPEEYFQSMKAMAEFTMHITKPTGNIPQIGDNDSGRFLKLEPKYQKMTVKEAKENFANLDGYINLPDDADYFMENHLDCGHLVGCAFGLFGEAVYSNWLGDKENAWGQIDSIMMRVLSKEKLWGSQENEKRPNRIHTCLEIGNEKILNEQLSKLEDLPRENVRKIQFNLSEGDLLTELSLHSYPHFGLFLLKSPNLYLAIRCWINKEIIHSSHMHQDQLSMELTIKGQDLVRDPGTYLYTPLPAERNKYRRSGSHFSPFVNSLELNKDIKSTFGSVSLENVFISYFGRRGFIAQTQEIKDNSHLVVSLESKSVIIYQVNFTKQYSKFIENQLPFSPGYGIKLRHGGESYEQVQFRNSVAK